MVEQDDDEAKEACVFCDGTGCRDCAGTGEARRRMVREYDEDDLPCPPSLEELRCKI